MKRQMAIFQRSCGRQRLYNALTESPADPEWNFGLACEKLCYELLKEKSQR